MPYEIPRDTVTIAFDAGGFAGAEVTCRLNVPISVLNSTRVDFSKEPTAEEAALRQFVVRWVVSWNLTEDGEPIPVTWEGAQRVPSDLIYSVMGVWRDALTEYVKAPAPLGPVSLNGKPSEEELVATAAW